MICSDIWPKYHEWYFKIVTRNLRQFWNIARGIYAKYHVQIMLLFVYTATHERFVIFTCRYFNLSRKYHCSKPIKLQKFLISHACWCNWGYSFLSLFIYKKIIIINTCSFSSVVSTKTWPLWLTLLLATFEIFSLRKFKVSQGLFCLFY